MPAFTVFQKTVLNGFHSMTPKGFYDPKKGHTGVDFSFKVGDTLLSPLTFTVVKVVTQVEMGKCLYARHDATGDIYVFAHNNSYLRGVGDKVMRLDPLVITGNTGSKTTAPHSHIEGISLQPIVDPAEGGSPINKIMSRSLSGFVGFNFDVLLRFKALYKKNGIDLVTGKQIVPDVPHNANGF